jgi:hypothetical protein
LRTLDRDAPGLAEKVRGALARDDDYSSPGKPSCDWDDPAAREAVVDELVRDCLGALGAIDGADLDGPAKEAAELLALVAGQDTEQGEDGVFRIAKRVAPDRVISTVDVETRHGHKSHARKFDGSKRTSASTRTPSSSMRSSSRRPTSTLGTGRRPLGHNADDEEKPSVMGDCAYGTAETLERLTDAGYGDIKARVAPARGREGRFGKDDFVVDLGAETVTCPAGQSALIRTGKDGSGRADFAPHCSSCPLAARCSTATGGRTVTIHRREDLLQAHKAAQATPEWQADYTGTRPKVERKIAHFVRHPWGGRRARVRGITRITTDADTRAAVINWARLAVLGLTYIGGRWTAAPP